MTIYKDTLGLLNNSNKDSLFYSSIEENKRDPLKERAYDDFFDESKNVKHNIIKLKKINDNGKLEWRLMDQSKGMIILYQEDLSNELVAYIQTAQGMQNVIKFYKQGHNTDKLLIQALTNAM